MSEDRPANDPAVELGQLRRDYEDLKSTLLAQAGRRPVGDIEATIRTTPKANTLLLQGQAVSRATYAVLWQWVQDQELVGAGKPFGVGDGSTTFVLPDYRDRALAGASASRPPGTQFGAQTKVITTAELPSHSHNIDIGSETQAHGHPSTGNHVGHAWEACSVGAAAPGSTAVLFSSFSSPGALGGNHYHGNNGNGHEHYVTVFASGSSSPFNVEQASATLNVLIYC